MADLYGNYVARLDDVDAALVGNNFPLARSAHARAVVALSKLPSEILIGQQVTRFVDLQKQLDATSKAIDEAENAFNTGGGTGVGFAQTVKAY